MRVLPNRIWMEFDEFTIRTGSRERINADGMECMEYKIKVVSNRTRRDLFEATVYAHYGMFEGRMDKKAFSSLAYEVLVKDLTNAFERNIEKIEARLLEERLEFELMKTSKELQALNPSPKRTRL